MNDYNCRAKDQSGNWVYGYLVHFSKTKKMAILENYGDVEQFTKVKWETACECIGRCDINGKEIYTNDIVEYFDWC